MIQVLFSVLILVPCALPSDVRTEFEQKVKELNGTGNSEAALSK